MKCDTCGDNVATNRCHDCPHDHRSCDDCSCDDWQNYCKKKEDDKKSDEKTKPKDAKKDKPYKTMWKSLIPGIHVDSDLDEKEEEDDKKDKPDDKGI